MYKIILFDLDGTLIDSSDDICDSVNYSLVHHDINPLSKKEIMCHVGVGAEYLIENVLARRNKTNIKIILKTFLEYYSSHSIVKTKLYDGVINLLQNKKALYGVITNKPSTVGVPVLKKLGVENYLKWKIFADTYGLLKPDPYAISKIIEDSGVSKEEIIYVGDTGIDLKFAKNAGVKSCLFDSGFGAITTFSEVKPDFEVESIQELEKIIFD